MKSSARWMMFFGTVSLWVGGSCQQQTVRPDEMSAARHRQEAQGAEAEAKQHEKSYDPSAWQNPPDVDESYNFSVPIYNPTEWHLDEAERLREHAVQHQRAAKLLERFEQAECRHFPAATRASCPLLGPVTAIVDIPDGIRATFASGTRAGLVVAHMRCHYAYAQAQGFIDAASCPLYVKGIEIRPSADKTAVEIVSKDPNVSDAIRARSHEEAVFLHGRSLNPTLIRQQTLGGANVAPHVD